MRPEDTIAPSDLTTLPLPARESHSSLSTYAACPRRYAFRYVERLPGEVPRWWFTFGSAVHRAFEAFDRAWIRARGDGMPAPGYDVLARAFGEAVEAAGCDPLEAARYHARSGPVLLTYLERAVTSDAEPVGVELGFGIDVPVAGDEVAVRFVGYIDRIDRRPDGAIEVIDHKTGKLRSQGEVDQDRQLTAYAFACARDGLRDPATGAVLPAAARLGLHFAETGLMVWTTRSAEDLEAFSASLVAEVGAIRRREFGPRPGSACRWCEYRSTCADTAPLAS
ncbi:MAG: PD-(D/E)XK nuclease family protein, partial [Chloroflexota bacterium]|nr:PD-(D/E)XK nuclease family protein [Chloroflexota bacterium]